MNPHLTEFIASKILLVVRYFKNENGDFDFKNKRVYHLFIISIILIVVWIIFFSVRTFSDVKREIVDTNRTKLDNITSAFHTALLYLSSIGFLAILIYWFIYIIGSFNKTHNVGGLISNIIVIFI